jgi:hypothetical protein
MAKTAIVSGPNPGFSRGDDPPYPLRDSRPMAKTAILPANAARQKRPAGA